MRKTTSLAVLCLCLLAAACVRAWEPQYGPVPQTAAANQGRTVRVMLRADGTPVELRNMRVEGDSIVGEVGAPPRRYAVATDDVQMILVSKTDTNSAVRTGIITTGQVVLALTLAGLIALLALIEKIPD